MYTDLVSLLQISLDLLPQGLDSSHWERLHLVKTGAFSHSCRNNDDTKRIEHALLAVRRVKYAVPFELGRAGSFSSLRGEDLLTENIKFEKIRAFEILKTATSNF